MSAYRALQESIEFLGSIRILPFDTAAAARFRTLRSVHRRSGTNDLRIAAMALEAGAVLVTRNHGDFSGISGLPLDDWS